MPTQAQLDAEQARTKSLSGTIGKIDLGAGVYDLNTRPDDNKEGADERIQNDGIDHFDPNIIDDDSGGGLPDGYVETAVIICVDGAPVYGQFLFKEDDPQP